MSQEPSIQKGTFKTIQIIYGALIFGVLLFTIFGYAFAENPVFKIDMNDILTIAVPMVAISGVFLSNLLYVKVLNKITLNNSLSAKLTQYQSAIIVRAAFLEGPAFLAIVATFLSDNASFLFVSLFMLVVMYFKFPTKEKFANELSLNFKEKSELDKL